MSPLLAARDLVRSFGATRALDGAGDAGFVRHIGRDGGELPGSAHAGEMRLAGRMAGGTGTALAVYGPADAAPRLDALRERLAA